MWRAKLLKEVPLKLENQIKVTNRSSSNNPFGKKNVISFTMYYNLAPHCEKNITFLRMESNVIWGLGTQGANQLQVFSMKKANLTR